MHDPMTVAWEIKAPWRVGGPQFRYRPAIVTMWHVDPERDGSDDSCGWFAPRLTKRQLERLRNAAWSEARNPYFLRYSLKAAPIRGRDEMEALYRGLILYVAAVLDIPCTYEYAAKTAARTIHGPDCFDSANVFCFLHGYHSNFPDTEPGSEQDRRLRQDHFTGVTAGLARTLLADRRPMWRHPRFHFWHYQIQIHWPFRRLSAGAASSKVKA